MKFQSAYQQLNTEQKRAVDIVYGPVLAIAGPGTGKTQLLASRIAQMLLGEAQIFPGNILCLTYTNAGAVAMRNRLLDFIGPTAYQVEICTFHSFCNEIVQSHADYFGIREMEPVSQLEALEIIHEIIDGLEDGHILKRYRGDVYYETSRLQNLFTQMKEEYWTPEFIQLKCEQWITDMPSMEAYQYKRAYKGYKAGDPKEDLIAGEIDKLEKTMAGSELFSLYNEKLIARNRYDFSDMIHWVVDKFAEDENFLRSYQERFQYILVDEFQDTSGVQMNLLNQLLSFWEKPNIFAVGDDDQAVYEFNGARIANIREFQLKYDPEIIVLTKNYRSYERVLTHAGKVISNNVQRLVNFVNGISKDLEPMAKYSTKETSFTVLSTNTIRDEEVYIADKICELTDAKVPPESIAVLYRKHKQAERLIRLLKSRNVPIMVKREDNILSGVIVPQLIKIIELLSRDNINEFTGDMFYVAHFPYFKINYTELEAYYTSIGRIELKEGIAIDYMEFAEYVKKLNEIRALKFELSLPDYIREIMDRTGMLVWIYAKDDHLKYLNELTSFFSWVKSEVYRDPFTTDVQLIERISRMVKSDIHIPVENLDFDQQGVTLSTIHGAKGLEWDHVFVMGSLRKEWEKSRGPQNRFTLPKNITASTDEDQLESNRRLFYVAMTRAKKKLMVTYPVRDDNKTDLERSQFIDEMGLANINGVSVEVPEKVSAALADLAPITFKPNMRENMIDRALEGMFMSVSSVNKYIKCKVAFYYENVIRVPFVANDALVYGNSVHIANKKLYDFYKETHQILPLNEYIEVMRIYLSKNRGQIGEKAYERRLVLGKSVLNNYYNEIFPVANKVVLTEFQIKGKLGDVPFVYIADKMGFNGNLVDMTDYKTGTLKTFKDHIDRPGSGNKYGGEYFRQGVIGKMMLDNIQYKPWKFNSFGFEIMDVPYTFYPLEIQPGDEDLMQEMINEAYEGIMRREFSPGCGDKDCYWCNLVKNTGI